MNTWLSMHLIYVAPLNIVSTRMHSSRMRTARSSSRPGGLHQAPPGTRHPSRDQAPPWDQIPFRTRHTLQRRPPSRPGTPPGADPPGPGTPPRGQTHTCKHITLPQTSFAGSKSPCNVHMY